ncbi:hypothetical protein ABXN37_21035 [Piscinibacter sakaiensis]|uniref:hypothetical protein n=1 Tax=Piscinibacter sakaiensis TaxID=1547922 RepID=UPI003728E5E1
MTIEVLGTVRQDASFVAQTLQARDGEHPAFVAAVREVIGHWRFLPAVDDASCTATDAPARLFVTFAGSAAAPSISITRPAATPRTIPRVTDLFNRMRRPSFTGLIEGRVLVLSLIDPDGVSRAVSVRYSSAPGRFDRAVLDHARRTLVDWAPPNPTAAVCTQREYRMCLDPADRHAADVVRHPVCDEPGAGR